MPSLQAEGRKDQTRWASPLSPGWQNLEISGYAGVCLNYGWLSIAEQIQMEEKKSGKGKKWQKGMSGNKLKLDYSEHLPK